MSGQIPRPMGPIALVAALLVWGVSVGVPTTTARADDCLAEPNSSAPAGSHWYYHLDKTTQRKCWYIRATDQPAQPAAAEATSDGASLSPAPPISAEEPAAASANIPMSISPGDSTPPSPRVKVPAVKPRPASVSSATSPQSVQQSAPKATPQGSSASSVREPPAAKAPLSSQISDPAVPARAPAATPAWPDPPVAAAIAPEPTAPPSDARTESLRPTVDTSVSDDAKNTSRGGPSTNNPTGTTSTSLMPVEMLFIAALGLVVAGFLLRIVMKISAARRRRITIDHHDVDRIDDRLKQELHEDQIAHQPDALSEFLQRSPIPAATNSSGRRPSPIDSDPPDITRARDSVSHIKNKISMPQHQNRHDEWDDRPPHRWSDHQHHESGSIDSPEPDWNDDRHRHVGRNDQERYASAGEADELLDDLQRSLLAAASDHRPRPSSLQVDDELSNYGHGEDGSSQVSDEIREREEVLERLRRDLDRLLQSPKVA
jgi:hypothetical protein